MKMFLFIVSLFIGILAYNIYTPTKKELEKEWSWQAGMIHSGKQMEGFFVGLFFGGASFFGLNSLCSHFIKDKKRTPSADDVKATGEGEEQ